MMRDRATAVADLERARRRRLLLATIASLHITKVQAEFLIAEAQGRGR